MKTAIAQVCSLSGPLTKDIEGYSAARCPAIEIWLTKVEEFLQTRQTDELLRLAQDHHVELPVASFQGGLLTSQGDRRKEAWDSFRRRLQLCEALKVETIVIAADIMAPIQQADVDRARVSLEQAAGEAGRRGLRVAIEFQSRAAFCNNLQTAAALVSEIASPHLGICLDVFHFHIGPSKLADLGYLTDTNLFHVQLSDLADTPREFAADSHRILPGDGDFDLDSVVQHLKQIQYSSWVSMELFNPKIWQIPPLQFGEIGMTALRKVLGLASMQ